MNREMLWRKLIMELESKSIDVHTNPRIKTKPLWFRSYSEKGIIYVENSLINETSTRMRARRIITEKDFKFVAEYYERWLANEINIRHIVSRTSRNTAYIFGIINYLRIE